jgi:hypothetical protein
MGIWMRCGGRATVFMKGELKDFGKTARRKIALLIL